MPGGCYVEGVSLDDAYFWKPSVGPIQDRPGHYNGPWHYWSTDGDTIHNIVSSFVDTEVMSVDPSAVVIDVLMLAAGFVMVLAATVSVQQCFDLVALPG